MIVDPGESLNWYDGPTLLEILEVAPAAPPSTPKIPLPGPVRLPSPGFRQPRASRLPGFMGRVESGTIKVGDAVTVPPTA